MGAREIILGRSGGKSAWQHLKDKWAAGRAEERWNKAFARAYNPLGLQPGDLVELSPELTGGEVGDDDSYEVDSVIWYATPEGSPDIVRYGLSPMIGGEAGMLLEVMPGEGPGELLHGLFRLQEDIELDDDVVGALEADTLTYDAGDGPVDFAKDFETEATITAFGKEHALTEIGAWLFNFYDPDDETSYVSVDAFDAPIESASIHLGRGVDGAAIRSYGTVRSS